ncbi:MAG: NADH-quinone oxidoreductase subunit N [Halobacteriales archaeon]
MATELPGWVGLAPTLLLAATALALLVFDMIDPRSRNRTALAGITLAGTLSAAGMAAWYLVSGTGRASTGGPISLFDGQLLVDGTYVFFSLVFAAVAALVVAASYDYLRDHAYQAEYYSLLALAATGMSLMASANSLVTVFVSLELSSLPSYALVSFLKQNEGSVEGGLKYFVVGAAASAVFAYGISLVYGATGVLQLDAVAAGIGTAPAGLVGMGLVMVVGGFAFKTASVPFHFWAPEAYEGAPAPISGFLSSASKAAGFAVAFRVITTAFPLEQVAAAVDWVVLFQILAVATMLLGNFAAAVQENVKRMLAYSSIGHAGYALIGLAAAGGALPELVMGAAMMHLLVYGFMNTGAFMFVALAEYWGVGRTFEDYNGLAKQAPMASLAMTVFLFSLAGLPVGGGFLSKYFLFLGAVEAGFWWLAAVGAVVSALSLYYYSRLVKALWLEEPTREFEFETQPSGIYAAIMIAAVVTVLLLPAFGVGFETAVDAAGQLVG